MSIIHRIRQSETPKAAKQLFEPLFIAAVKKNGYYLMTENSLNEYKEEAKRYGYDFKRWLELNNLTIEKTSTNNYRITFKKQYSVIENALK